MGALQVTMGLYATVLPFAVLGAWLALALWDLAGAARDGTMTRGRTVPWAFGMLVLPVVAPPVYLLTTARLPRWLAGTFVVGGIAAYGVVLLLAAAIGAAG
jgi:hypothetical protein